jgi:hypothetical protein
MTSYKILIDSEYAMDPKLHLFLEYTSVNVGGHNANIGAFTSNNSSDTTNFVLETVQGTNSPIFHIRSSDGLYLSVSDIDIIPKTKESITSLEFKQLNSNSLEDSSFLLEDITQELGVVLRNISTNQLLSYHEASPTLKQSKNIDDVAVLTHYNASIMRLVEQNGTNVQTVQQVLKGAGPVPVPSDSHDSVPSGIPPSTRIPNKNPDASVTDYKAPMSEKTKIILGIIAVILALLFIVFLVRFK